MPQYARVMEALTRIEHRLGGEGASHVEGVSCTITIGLRWISHVDSGQPRAAGLDFSGSNIRLSRTFFDFCGRWTTDGIMRPFELPASQVIAGSATS